MGGGRGSFDLPISFSWRGRDASKFTRVHPMRMDVAGSSF